MKVVGAKRSPTKSYRYQISKYLALAQTKGVFNCFNTFCNNTWSIELVQLWDVWPFRTFPIFPTQNYDLWVNLKFNGNNFLGSVASRRRFRGPGCHRSLKDLDVRDMTPKIGVEIRSTSTQLFAWRLEKLRHATSQTSVRRKIWFSLIFSWKLASAPFFQFVFKTVKAEEIVT